MSALNLSSILQNKSVLDTALLSEIIDDNPSMMTEILLLYVEDVSERLQSLHRHIIQNNIEELKQEIHTIKGSSSAIGAKQMEGLLREIEIIGKNGGISDYNEILSPILESFYQVTRYIYQLQEDPDVRRTLIAAFRRSVQNVEPLRKREWIW